MINAVYIIYNGICLFSHQYKINISRKDNIVSAFISAINQFATHLAHKDLKRLILEDEIFSFSKISDVLFVFSHDNLKDSKLRKITTIISDKFFERYGSEFNNWDGEVSQFEKFYEVVDNIIGKGNSSILLEMENFLQNHIQKSLDKSKKKKKIKVPLNVME